MTSRILQHIVGGDILFSGCVLIGWGLWLLTRSPRVMRWGHCLLVLGAFGVGFSATPFPSWFYAIWAGALCLAVWSQRSGKRPETEARQTTPPPNYARPRWSVILAGGITVVAVIWEAPWHLPPRISERPQRIMLLGDSISAGINDGEPTWPGLFADETGIEVTDFSRAAATVETFNRLLDGQAIELAPGLVIIELGGNDLLGGTTSTEFAEQLDKLLARITSDHEVLMFELPLPPTYNRFGVAQRELATRYSVQLIPKRDFAGLLLSEATTLDSLHLSAAGHRQFAEYMAQLFPDRRTGR